MRTEATFKDLPLVLFLLWDLATCRRQAHEDLERVVSVPVSSPVVEVYKQNVHHPLQSSLS